MIQSKTSGLLGVIISTLFIFQMFSSVTNAQSSSSLYNLYSPEIYYYNINSPQMDNSNIYTPKADQSDIYTINQDLIDFHHTSLYESIHSNEGNDNNSLLIVLDNKGDVISVIQLNNEAKSKQKDYEDK